MASSPVHVEPNVTANLPAERSRHLAWLRRWSEELREDGVIPSNAWVTKVGGRYCPWCSSCRVCYARVAPLLVVMLSAAHNCRAVFSVSPATHALAPQPPSRL